MSHKPFTQEQYQALYEKSIQDPQGFWAEQAGKYIKGSRINNFPFWRPACRSNDIRVELYD